MEFHTAKKETKKQNPIKQKRQQCPKTNTKSSSSEEKGKKK